MRPNNKLLTTHYCTYLASPYDILTLAYHTSVCCLPQDMDSLLMNSGENGVSLKRTWIENFNNCVCLVSEYHPEGLYSRLPFTSLDSRQLSKRMTQKRLTEQHSIIGRCMELMYFNITWLVSMVCQRPFIVDKIMMNAIPRGVGRLGEGGGGGGKNIHIHSV